MSHTSDEVGVAIRSHYPNYVEAVTSPLGRALGRTGVTPNALTTLGLLLTAVATALVGSGALVIGGWVLLVGGLMDAFDGAVARATGRSTPFGSFYDSVSDRVSDGLILAGLAWYLRDEPRLFALTVAALVAASVTSYVRAKAEAIDLECSVGIMERAERAILLMTGLILHRWLLEPVLWALAVGGSVTVVQRIHHVWCQIDRDIPEELLVLASYDRAWSRAFTAAARRFYGRWNFDGAVGDRAAAEAAAEAAAAEAAEVAPELPERDVPGGRADRSAPAGPRASKESRESRSPGPGYAS